LVENTCILQKQSMMKIDFRYKNSNINGKILRKIWWINIDLWSWL
jgi:hypothetical protein